MSDPTTWTRDELLAALRDTEAAREDWMGAARRMTERQAAAERWRVEVAEGLGYINRAEGQAGHEIAEPSVIIEAFRAAERESRALAERAAALEGKWGASACGEPNFGRAEAFRECIVDLRAALASEPTP